MDVQFEATLDELVDVSLRSIETSKTSLSRQRRSHILASLSLGLIAIILIPGSTILKLGIGIAVSLVVAILYPLFYRRALDRNIRETLKEQLHGSSSFTVEVELTEEGIAFHQLGTRITHDWANVKAVSSTAHGVDFTFKGGGIATVRDRAFAAPDQRDQFIERAQAMVRSAVKTDE